MNTDEPVSRLPATEFPEPITAEEAKFFFDESQDVFVISELSTGRVIKANAAERSILGADFWKAASFIELIHPDDRESAISVLKSLREGNSAISEHRCLTRDGSYVWMEFRGVPVVEQNRIYAVGRDISKRKEAELKSNQLTGIVESSCEAIFQIALDNSIISWNKGAENIFGYSLEEVEGKEVGMLFRDPVAVPLPTNLQPELEREFACKRKDNREIAVSMMLTDVFDEAQKLVGYAIFARDIEHRKELEKRVREFYSAVSHELRTPLTSIRGALGMIAGGLIEPTSPEAHELIEIANESAERLIKLINDILDVRRIETGKLELKKTLVLPSKLMDSAVRASKDASDKAKVELRVDMEESLPPLFVSEHRIVQVLLNLISNAIKFSQAERVVTIRAQRAAGESVRFSVCDLGCGIALEKTEKLFGKFQQLDSSDSRKHGGAGLGLAIAKSLVEEHGGTIGFFNTNPGCTFWFELPIQSNASSGLATPAVPGREI